MDLQDEYEIPTLDNYRVYFLASQLTGWLYHTMDPKLSFRIVDTDEEGYNYWVEDVDLELMQEVQHSIYSTAYNAPSPAMIEVMIVQMPFKTAKVAIKATEVSKFVHIVNNTRAKALSQKWGEELTDSVLESAFFSK